LWRGDATDSIRRLDEHGKQLFCWQRHKILTSLNGPARRAKADNICFRAVVLSEDMVEVLRVGKGWVAVKYVVATVKR
jgi:hypothetical protein